MIFEVKELLKVLKNFECFINSKVTYSIVNKINFTKEKIIYNNGVVYLEYNLNSDFECSVDLKDIVLFLSKTLFNEVDIQRNENKLILKTEKEKLILSVNDIKLESNYQDFNYIDLPNNFYDGLQLCLITVDEIDQHRFVNGIYINENDMAGTNGKILGLFNLSKKIDNEIIIPYNVCNNLLKIEKFNQYYYENDNIYLKNDNMFLHFKKMGGNYPPYKQIFEGLKNYTEFYFPENIKKEIDLFSILDDDDNFSIEVKIKDNKIICKKSSETTELEIILDEGDQYNLDISFLINKSFLERIVKKESFNCKLYDNCVLFENDNFKYICMLMVS